MAQRFLTDIDVKGNISVTGDVTSTKIDTTNLTLGEVAVHLPEGATGSVTVATSADVETINQSLETKQETIVVAEGSGLTKAEDGKTFGIDTTVIATAQSVSDVSDVADAAKEAAETNAEAIEALDGRIDTLEAGATSHYEVTPAEGQDDITAITAAIPEGKTAIKGDTAVAKKIIAGGKMSYTAYVFDGTNWAAMDGNYSASNVYLSKNIKMNGFSSVGNISISTGSSNETALAAGKSIEQALAALFSKEEHPTASKPSLSVSFKKDGSTFTTHNVEHGTTFTLSYDSTFTDNKFTPDYEGQTKQPNVGCAVDGWSAKLMESASAMKDGTTDLATEDGSWEVTANAGEVYQMVIKAGYTASSNKGITSDGNESNVSLPAVAVTSSSALSASSNKITAYRKSFYGSMAAKLKIGADGYLYSIGTGENGADELVTSAKMRQLTSSTSSFAAGSTFNCSVTAGHLSALFAYPTNLRDVTSVLDSNDSNANIVGSFKQDGNKGLVKIADAAGDESDYKVFFMNYNMTGGAASNTLKVTI